MLSLATKRLVSHRWELGFSQTLLWRSTSCGAAARKCRGLRPASTFGIATYRRPTSACGIVRSVEPNAPYNCAGRECAVNSRYQGTSGCEGSYASFTQRRVGIAVKEWRK